MRPETLDLLARLERARERDASESVDTGLLGILIVRAPVAFAEALDQVEADAVRRAGGA